MGMEFPPDPHPEKKNYKKIIFQKDNQRSGLAQVPSLTPRSPEV